MMSRRIRARRRSAASILREQQRWRAMADAAYYTVSIQPLMQLKDDHDDEHCVVCNYTEEPLDRSADVWDFDNFDLGGPDWRWTPWRPVFHRAVWEPAEPPSDASKNMPPAYACTYQLENGKGACSEITFAPDGAEDHCCFVEGGDPGPLFGTR